MVLESNSIERRNHLTSSETISSGHPLTASQRSIGQTPAARRAEPPFPNIRPESAPRFREPGRLSGATQLLDPKTSYQHDVSMGGSSSRPPPQSGPTRTWCPISSHARQLPDQPPLPGRGPGRPPSTQELQASWFSSRSPASRTGEISMTLAGEARGWDFPSIAGHRRDPSPKAG